MKSPTYEAGIVLHVETLVLFSSSLNQSVFEQLRYTLGSASEWLPAAAGVQPQPRRNQWLALETAWRVALPCSRPF